MKIVIDVEATCWESKLDTRTDQNEIIEIGAVFTDDFYEPLSEFQAFIKPIRNPELSDFCKQLTTISQADVDSACSFREVMEAFAAFTEARFDKRLDQLMFCSWGNYDRNQFQKDCHLHLIEYPLGIHLNLKEEFAKWRHHKPCGVAKALNVLKLDFSGTHHRGIDDARMITAIARDVWGVKKWSR